MKSKKETKEKVVNKCKKCGKKFSRLVALNEAKLSFDSYCPDCDCEMTIKLKKWQIPILLGAISLGIELENWSEEVLKTIRDVEEYQVLPCYTDSDKWRYQAWTVMKQVKKQTGVVLEYFESAGQSNILEDFHKLVEKEWTKRIKSWDDYKNEKSKYLQKMTPEMNEDLWNEFYVEDCSD